MGARFKQVKSGRERYGAASALPRGLLEVGWNSVAGEVQHAAMGIVNVSHEGMQLDSAEALPMNTLVKVRGERLKSWAWVRYCEPQGDRFRVGLNLVNELE